MFNKDKAHVDKDILGENTLDINKQQEKHGNDPGAHQDAIDKRVGSPLSSSMTKTALMIGAAACTAVSGVIVAPVILSAAGLATTVIAAGSIGAGMISKAATIGTMFNKDTTNVDNDNTNENTLQVNKQQERHGNDPGAHQDTINTRVDRIGSLLYFTTRKTALVICTAAGAAVGGVYMTPFILSAAGFGTTGIAAGSFGAGMMSKAATAGIGMGVVSALQSAGAAGISTSTSIVIGMAVGGGVAAAGSAAGNSHGDSVGQMPATPDASTNTGTDNVINNEREAGVPINNGATNTGTRSTSSGDENVNKSDANNNSKEKPHDSEPMVDLIGSGLTELHFHSEPLTGHSNKPHTLRLIANFFSPRRLIGTRGQTDKGKKEE